MTAPLGRAFVEVLADLKKFPADLKKKLQKSLDDVGKTVDFDEFERTADKAGVESSEKFVEGYKRDAEGPAKQKLKRIAEKQGSDTGTSFMAKLRAVMLSKGGLIGALVPLAAGVLGEAQGALPALLASLPALAVGAAAGLGTLLLATHGFFAAVGAGVSGDGAAFAESLQKLAPAAQSVAKEIVGLTGAFHGLQQEVQQAFFTQLEGSFARLAGQLLPELHRWLPVLGKDFGGLFNAVLSGVGSQSSNIGIILQNLDAGLKPFIPVLNQLTQVFFKVAAAAAPFIAALAGSFAKNLGDFLTNIDKSLGNGGMVAFFETAGHFFADLGNAIGPVLGLVEDLLNALSGVGSPTLALIGTVATVLRQAIAPLLGPLGRFLGVALKGAGVLLEDLEPALEGIASGLGQFLDAISDQLPDLITNLSPLFSDIGLFIGEVGKDLGPVLAEVAKDLFPALVEVLKDLQPLWEQMTPVLLDLVKQLFPELVPLVKALVDLFVALLPLLPPLVQIMIDWIPVIEKLIPLLVLWVQWITAVIMVVDLIVRWISTLIGWILKLIVAWDKLAINSTLLPFLDSVTGALNKVIGALEKAINKTKDFLGLSSKKETATFNPGGGGAGGGGGPAPKALAGGGLITRPTLAMVGEAGYPEAVIPMDSAGNAKATAKETGLLDMLGTAGDGAFSPTVNVYLGLGQFVELTDKRVDVKLGKQAQQLAFGTRGGQ